MLAAPIRVVVYDSKASPARDIPGAFHLVIDVRSAELGLPPTRFWAAADGTLLYRVSPGGDALFELRRAEHNFYFAAGRHAAEVRSYLYGAGALPGHVPPEWSNGAEPSGAGPQVAAA